ncbi:MAG: hypothetical protein IJT00_06185 [Lachnospiraceae bacterium]|nr:hypothetical protein [Lachnospiraceae bacterium]
MELSAPRGFRWDIWIPCVTAVLILAAILLCILLRKEKAPDIGQGLRLERILNAETGETVSDTSLEEIQNEIARAGSGESEAFSGKLPPLSLVFSDGMVLTVRFTVRGDTVYMEKEGKGYWLYSEKLSRLLSSAYYTSTLPEPTESPAVSPSPSVSPAP